MLDDGLLYIYSLAATPELVEPHLEGKTLADALSSDKMFIIDLTYLANIECSDDRTVRLLSSVLIFYL